MAEEVRMNRYAKALPTCPVRNPELHGARTQAPAVPADEDRQFGRLGELCARRKPALKRLHGLPAHRHDARLVALAEQAHGAIREIKIQKIKADELGKAQS